MNRRDLCFVLCAVAHIMISAGMVMVDSIKIEHQPIVEIVEESVPMVEPYDCYSAVYVYHTWINCNLDTTPVIYHIEPNLEDYTALMYAKTSLGRYYITAYNHKETGSKMTASGKTCHEGTITTCAADPKYHKFGEYLEVDGRLYVVEDTGSAVKRKHIDLYFASYKSMAKYGSNYQEIYRVEFPFGKPGEK